MKVKNAILNIIFPQGKFASIKAGPLKGYKFMVSENSGWSPIVGRWETELQQLFSLIIRKDWTLYDLGANNGIHTLLFSKLVGPSGKVYSFEPISSNIKEIEMNYTANGVNNVEIVPKAVSNTNGVATFLLGKHDKQGSLFSKDNATNTGIEVQTITLDTFVQQGVRKPDLMKVDIEGAEGYALEGYSRFFAEHQPSVIVELHSKEQDRKVGDFFQKQGYYAYRVVKHANDNDLGLPHLEKIEHFDKEYPFPKGFWGTVFAFHPDKINLFKRK